MADATKPTIDIGRILASYTRALAQEQEDLDPSVQCLPDQHDWQRDDEPVLDSLRSSHLLPQLQYRQRCTRCRMTRWVALPPPDYGNLNRLIFPKRKDIASDYTTPRTGIEEEPDKPTRAKYPITRTQYWEKF